MLFAVSSRLYIAALTFLTIVFVPVLSADDLYFEKRDISAITVPSVTGLTQDDRGYLWIGTPGGLVRYDGRKHSLINRKSHPGLPADQILAVEYDPASDQLWIGTPAGLSRFSLVDDKIRPVEIEQADRNDTSVEIIDLAIGNNSVFAVSSNGIYRSVSGNSMDRVTVEPAIVDDFIEMFDAAAGTDGSIWAAASDGLKQWDEDLLKFRHVLDVDGARSVSVINGEVWCADMRAGLFRYSPETGKADRFPTAQETSVILGGPDGFIWAGSGSDGLKILDAETRDISSCSVDSEHPNKLPSTRINSLLLGNSGHIWVGTADSGLFSVDVRKENHLEFTKRSGSNGLPSGSIQVLFEDSLGYIWTGSDIGGLARIDPLYGEVRQYAHDSGDIFSVSGDFISGITEDSSGRLWIGTDQGPCMYLTEVDGFEPVGVMMSGWPDFRGSLVLALAKGSDGSVWMSFKSGELYRLDPQERDYSVSRFPPSSVPSVLLTDRQGTLWAGSRKNLRIFDSDGKLLKTWLPAGVDNGGFNEGGVNVIFQDSRSRIWLGGPTGVSLYMGYNDGFEALSLPDNRLLNISGISEDRRGYLWITDGRQIYIYSPEGEYLTTMGGDVGLTPSGLITSIRLGRDGTMYVGASGEIWTFDSFIENPPNSNPKVYLTELKIMNQVSAQGHGLDEHKPVELSSDEKVFSISFGAVDYRYRSKINYQYKLEGFDDGWVDLGETDSVTFANLSPRDYSFIVRAVNEKGQFSENTAELEIVIKKSFWVKPYAIIIYAVVFFGFVGLFLKLWEGHLMKNQIQELEIARLKIVEANKRLSFLTMNDTLTGLLNRRGFDQGLSHALNTAQRNQLMITLIMMDVDFFKLYNDNYGHVQGDEVLRGVGKALRSVFGRSTDIIARYGGEEFAVVFIGENPNASVTLVNDLIIAIRDLGIIHEYSSASELLTLSTGSTTIRAEEYETAEVLINRADQALYAAKAGGRDRICYSGIIPELPETMKNNLKPLVINKGTAE
jgi:diguanylate cyclase (GGDEF)-like protein